MFKPANTVTKAVGGKYTSLLRQAEQHLLVKQAELQNAQRDVVEGEGYLQVERLNATHDLCAAVAAAVLLRLSCPTVQHQKALYSIHQAAHALSNCVKLFRLPETAFSSLPACLSQHHGHYHASCITQVALRLHCVLPAGPVCLHPAAGEAAPHHAAAHSMG
jgi:hypothetical protein